MPLAQAPGIAAKAPGVVDIAHVPGVALRGVPVGHVPRVHPGAEVPVGQDPVNSENPWSIYTGPSQDPGRLAPCARRVTMEQGGPEFHTYDQLSDHQEPATPSELYASDTDPWERQEDHELTEEQKAWMSL